MKFVELNRPDIKDEHLTVALEALISAIQKRIEKHGRAMVASDHEALGIIEEEYNELKDAITANDRDNIMEELFDVAVSCVITVASVVAGAEVAGRENDYDAELAELRAKEQSAQVSNSLAVAGQRAANVLGLKD
jgi:hypothetical protein